MNPSCPLRSGSALALLAAILLGCPAPPPARERSEPAAREDTGEAEANSGLRAPGSAVETGAMAPEAGGTDSPAEAAPPEDAMALHHGTTAELLALVWVPETDAGAIAARALSWLLGPVPGRFSQGNAAIARHSIGRSACLEGLRGVVLQTEEQRKTCKGMENMVPIYAGGDVMTAKACIDVFEFPNKACELPMVWGTPSEAEKICEIQGKRLCSQDEWNLACKADPLGKADTTYAYGDDLDLSICNTNKPHASGPDGQWLCNPHDAQAAWATCATETEPSGAFPHCRSRLGVFDQHGNVAEMMTRRGEGGALLTQLKGSAFFYVDVARRPDEAQKPGARETYPDQCTFDPRWHVEALESSLHSNYHLGFRCCLGI